MRRKDIGYFGESDGYRKIGWEDGEEAKEGIKDMEVEDGIEMGGDEEGSEGELLTQGEEGYKLIW